jgi:DNA polymerase (family 10)
MKTSAEAAELLAEIKRLMELKGENPFKVRAFDKAADAIAGIGDLGSRAKAGTLTEIPGVGKGIAEVLTEFLLKGTSRARDELREGLPPGLLELTQIPGLGPKKALQVIEELDIHSVRELEYACRENRLLKLKGFGAKAQQKILDGIQFMTQNAGQQRLGDALAPALALLEALREAMGDARVSDAGALRRRMETLAELDYLIEAESKAEPAVHRKVEAVVAKFRAAQAGLPEIRLHFAPPRRFGYELARLTATSAHWEALGSPAPFEAPSEEEFYAKLGLPGIPPEARETGEEVRLAKQGKLADLLPVDGIRGVFHNHTLRSDGTATLEQMVVGAKSLGFQYIGISDHSQSAFYAQGLKTPTLLEQEREVRAVQEKHPDIRVFWGIESDILADGSLDYDAKVLKKFDFVVASIHSRFQMDREAMTDRILEAVRNPYTRFLGHATGRLLLGRRGYDLHMEKIIAEAAKRDVAIEINAHPARLDIDWRWGPQLRECGTKVSVNPDAHAVEGLEDTAYGVTVARKALLSRGLVVNSREVKEVERWLRRA